MLSEEDGGKTDLRTGDFERLESYLEDHARRDNGRDAQLHQRTAVAGQHHAQPVHRVRGVGGDDAVERHLAHDQEDQERQLFMCESR